MLKLETAAKVTYADLPDFEAYIVVEDLEKFKMYKNNYSWQAIDHCIKVAYIGRKGVVFFRPLEDVVPSSFLVNQDKDTSYLVRRLIGSDGSLITSTEKRAVANYSNGIEKSGCRYRRARFDSDKGVKWIRMHRLVLAAFAKISEDCKELKLEVDHRDGNPANNSLKNLELVTHSENMRRVKFQQIGVAF